MQRRADFKLRWHDNCYQNERESLGQSGEYVTTPLPLGWQIPCKRSLPIPPAKAGGFLRF